MKNPASRASEGAGGFSLPNKAYRFNTALAAGLFFILPISLCQQSEGHPQKGMVFVFLCDPANIEARACLREALQ